LPDDPGTGVETQVLGDAAMHITDGIVEVVPDDKNDEDGHRDRGEKDGETFEPSDAENESHEDHPDPENDQPGRRVRPVESGFLDHPRLHRSGHQDLGNDSLPDPDEAERPATDDFQLIEQMGVLFHESAFRSITSAKGGDEIDDGGPSVADCQDPVDDGLAGLSPPVFPSVVDPLDQGSNGPENSDSGGEPARHFIAASPDIAGETKRENTEDHERDRDEPLVNDEHFLEKSGEGFEIPVPCEETVETHVDGGDGELSDRGCDEEFVEMVEDEVHDVQWFGWGRKAAHP